MSEKRPFAMVFTGAKNPAAVATAQKLSMLGIEHEVRPLSAGKSFAKFHHLRVSPMVVFWPKGGGRYAWEGHQPKLIERFARL